MHEKILITWDFTQLSEFALDAAIKLATKTNDIIKLLHILEKEDLRLEKEKLLKSVAEEVNSKYDRRIETLIETGSIFSTINEVAQRENANMVIMGTHGIKGIQKFTGSWALKVIEGSKVPFLVVQDQVSDNKNLRIVLPLDFKLENKEKLRWAYYFSKHYNCKIYLFSKYYKDKSLKQKLNANLLASKIFLQKNKIKFEINEAPAKGKFVENTIKFAGSLSADIILVTTNRNLNMATYVLGLPEQELIANSAKIPVLVVNPSISLTSKFTPY